MIEPFPFLYISVSKGEAYERVQDNLMKLGGVPFAILTNHPQDFPQGDPSLPQVIACTRENYEETIARTLLQAQQAFADYQHVVVYRDREQFPLPELEHEITIALNEPDALHFLELKEPPDERNTLKSRIMGFIREKLEGPKPTLWIIPVAAIHAISDQSIHLKFFPLLWLHRLRQENTPIRLTRLDPLTGSYEQSEAFSQPRLLIYALNLFLRYTASALISLLVDNLVFFLLISLGMTNAVALIGGRVVSLFVNYALLRTVVFKEKGSNLLSFVKYIGLVIFSGAIVLGVLDFFTDTFGFHALPVKICVELVMFFFNYFMSKHFVFRKKQVPA